MTYLMFWLFLCSLGCCHLAHSMFLEQPCGKALVPKILGSNASPLYAQYIAGIFNTTYFLCGGTIIHKDFVLTAAHCNNAQTLSVRLGAYNIQRPTDEIRVIETIPHPEYTNSTYVNDIALLKLERSVKFNINIQPICIYLDATLGKQIRYYNAFGWGKTKNAAQSDILQSVFLNRTNPMICQNHLGLIPDAKQICATSEEGDTCAGDSGGPLIAKINYQSRNFDTQFGIISYGSNECDGLGLYIDVLQYSGWIANTVRGNRDRDVVSRRENGRLLYADCTGDSMGSILMATIFGLQSYAKGVLITDRHVLTTADVSRADPYSLGIVVMGMEFQVSAIFKPFTNINISLIGLTRRLENKGTLRPICILKTTNLDGSLSITGTNQHGLSYVISVQSLKWQLCEHELGKNIQPNQFCVKNIFQPNALQAFGTAGDILVKKILHAWGMPHIVLLGLVEVSYNDVYVITSTVANTEWISEIVGQNG
ncbi:ovochymase-2 [Drosophila simulans]|uniref:Peptidase S1 domain-containing protein n=2 Tax=Drosophila simulans TaxID=7240 RepID=A0A0J9U4J5_DROSI|nr:ovochymase-2 [Drosophila simulans]KMY94550.1 uncharacterized protein Dsimw501_GD25474 [Drosophila simulans]